MKTIYHNYLSVVANCSVKFFLTKVFNHMAFEARLSCRYIITNIKMERFLSSVCPYMFFQISIT